MESLARFPTSNFGELHEKLTNNESFRQNQLRADSQILMLAKVTHSMVGSFCGVLIIHVGQSNSHKNFLNL